MNIKSALIRATVQLLAANTNLIRKPSPSEEFFQTLFGLESEEDRVARETEEAVDKAVAEFKRMNTNRKFRRITKCM